MNLRAVTWLAGLVACVAIWAGLAWAWRTHNEAMREEGRAEIREQWREAVRIAQKAEDHKEAAIRAAQEKADGEHAQALAAAAADAARARDAAERLRGQLAAYLAARCPTGGDRSAAGPSPGVQDRGALDLLADLFSRADREAGELGEYADRLRSAGELCERRYDALTAAAAR